MKESKRIYNALLFSVERCSYPYKYRLYFAITEQHNRAPQLHRFYVRSKKIFQSFRLGGSYNLEYKGLRILSAQKLEIRSLSDTEYFELVRLRDQQFMDVKSQEYLNVKSLSYQPSEVYYSFKVFKSLVEYQPDPLRMFLVNLSKLGCYFISFFVPIALYILLIYFFSSSSFAQSSSGASAFTIPTTAMCLLSFIIWMMYAFNTFIWLLLLNIDYMQPYLLKVYTIRWAGMRRSCYLENNIRRMLTKTGIITFSLAAISVILLFIL